MLLMYVACLIERDPIHRRPYNIIWTGVYTLDIHPDPNAINSDSGLMLPSEARVPDHISFGTGDDRGLDVPPAGRTAPQSVAKRIRFGDWAWP